MELRVLNQNGQLLVESREVAVMTGKQHKDLMRDIRNYDEVLTGANLRSLDFFIASTYEDGKGERRPCYLITRKGCDMVANKMTGEKGVLFTAAYVTKFEEMKKVIAFNIPQTLPEALRLAADLSEKNEELKIQNHHLGKKVENDAPRIAYLDTIIQSKALVTTTQIAKDYGLTAPELNKILHDLGIQYQVNKQWVLYRKYGDKGYTQSYSFDFKHKDGKPDVKMNTRWTQSGRKFIHEQLSNMGIKANIEKEYGNAK